MAAAAADTTISISSSSDEESGSGLGSEPEPESESESESEFEAESEEDESVSDDNDDRYFDEDDDVEDSKGELPDEKRCYKVIDLLRGWKNLNMLTLEECKAYLRKHVLRISGTKDTCIKRILEHWRLKDEDGEKLYPKSSFAINCTGDVCRDDVVLFEQKVYEKFDIVKRGGGGKVIGKRKTAGRVVKESYGETKQQHTFTIEVLWSKGVKALPLLSPLLVKGRNLYRLKTFRQRWTNEAERSRILAEKHRRGAAARHTRAIAKSIATNKGSRLKRKSSTTNAPPNKKRRKDSELPPGKNRHNNYAKKSPLVHANTRKTVDTRGSATKAHAKTTRVAKEKASSHGHADNTRNSEPFTIDPQRSSYPQPNGYHGECTYPHQRYPYNEHNLRAFEVNRGIHPIYVPSYNLGTTSSMFRMPHGHVPNNYNMGYASNSRSDIQQAQLSSFLYGIPRVHGRRRP